MCHQKLVFYLEKSYIYCNVELSCYKTVLNTIYAKSKMNIQEENILFYIKTITFMYTLISTPYKVCKSFIAKNYLHQGFVTITSFLFQ